MELIEPRPKKHCKFHQNFHLPVILKKDGTLYKFKGIFNDFCVVIENEEDMKNIISMGYFGKANLSRSYPQFNQTKTEIIRERQYNRRKDWVEKFPKKTMKNKVIVVPDSDEEKGDYVTNLQPQYQIDESNIKENVWLGLEEAFFLASAIKCLDIYYEGKCLSMKETWAIFSGDSQFIQNYVVYYHFRAKNWVVKPGIKFGGDFCKLFVYDSQYYINKYFLVLYKRGPPFYHASYVVIIDTVNENLDGAEHFSRRSMDNVTLLSLNRLCETAGKELLICQVIWPQNINIDYTNISHVIIKENLIRRWISTQERNSDDV